MSREAMKFALEALAVKFSEGWHEGIKIDASDIMLLNDAAQALAEQPARQALDKKAENARELGLDYEPVEVLGHNGWGFPIKAAAPVQKECDCAAHSAADCVCGAWDKSAAAPVQEDWGPGPHEYHSLTAPVQEPVAWRYRGILHDFDPSDWAEGPVTPLYTTPPAQPAQQEPVAYVVTTEVHGQMCSFIHRIDLTKLLPDGAKLYTTPPAAQRQWVGLTDEEIDQGLLRTPYAMKTAEAWREGVRWAYHQLKEKNT
jgi:hypothetical protein